MTFGQRLRAVMDERSPLCIGIDPHAELLAAWGLTDDPDGLERFTRTVVEAVADRVAVLKPQSACFERHGSKGIAILERVLADIRSAGAVALLDVKRGDIGSTMQAYAEAYLRPEAPLFADAITVSPFLGFGSLEPVIAMAERNDCGVFVLTLTSNPEGGEVQHAERTDGGWVAGALLDEIARRNHEATPMGSIGAVVGATLGETGQAVFARHGTAINGPVLAPGIGAQGGTMAALRQVLGARLSNVVPSISRGVLAAGPDVRALRDAAARALD